MQKSTPYSQQAQAYVAGDLQDTHPFSHNDTQETSSRAFGNDMPWIRDGQAGSEPEVGTYSMSTYLWETSDNIDAASYYAAEELAIKMVSKQGLYGYFNETMTGSEPTCKEINEYTFGWVMKNWAGPTSSLARYQSLGQKLEFLDDTVDQSESGWRQASLKYKNTTDAFTVRSQKYLSEPSANGPGSLYCKLMSPARVLEFMLVDGLQKNFHWVHNNVTSSKSVNEDGFHELEFIQ